jgi:hypothetical protein
LLVEKWMKEFAMAPPVEQSDDIGLMSAEDFAAMEKAGRAAGDPRFDVPTPGQLQQLKDLCSPPWPEANS